MVDQTLGRGLRLRQYPEGPIIGTMREGDPLIVLYGIDDRQWPGLDRSDRQGWAHWVGTADVHHDCYGHTYPKHHPIPNPETLRDWTNHILLLA